MEITFFQTNKQRKTHFEVHVGMWSMGLRVLKEPLLTIPFKWWMIFLSMKSKKREPIGGGWHFSAKKRGVWKWFSQKWVWRKMAKNTRIWKNIEGDERRKIEKLRKVTFLERKWWDEEKSSGRRRWIVTMVEERWRKEKAKKKKGKDKKNGGQNSTPHT